MATNVAVKKSGFFSRFFNSIGAIFIGIGLALICLIGLACNEARSVKTIRAYKEAEKNVIDTRSAQARAENDGKLVAIMGNLTYTPVADSEYGIEGTFVLRRIVEVYQYKERKEEGSTDKETRTYYEGGWYGSYINSANYPGEFKNPPWPSASTFQNATFYAQDVMLGGFNLGDSQLKGLEPNTIVSIPGSARDAAAGFNINRQYITNTANVNTPAIGDIRVSFLMNDATTASVIGKQQGNSIVTYTTKNKTPINRIFAGQITAQEIIVRLQAENKATTWLFRIILMVLVCIGFTMVFTPIQTLVSLIPFLGKYIGKATGFLSKLVGGIVGVVLSLIVIVIAWVAVRPIVIIPLLAVIAGLISLMVNLKKKKAAQAPQSAG